MLMPVNMILVMYVTLCILSYDFNKLAILYILFYYAAPLEEHGLVFSVSLVHQLSFLKHYPFKNMSEKPFEEHFLQLVISRK